MDVKGIFLKKNKINSATNATRYCISNSIIRHRRSISIYDNLSFLSNYNHICVAHRSVSISSSKFPHDYPPYTACSAGTIGVSSLSDTLSPIIFKERSVADQEYSRKEEDSEELSDSPLRESSTGSSSSSSICPISTDDVIGCLQSTHDSVASITGAVKKGFGVSEVCFRLGISESPIEQKNTYQQTSSNSTNILIKEAVRGRSLNDFLHFIISSSNTNPSRSLTRHFINDDCSNKIQMSIPKNSEHNKENAEKTSNINILVSSAVAERLYDELRTLKNMVSDIISASDMCDLYSAVQRLDLCSSTIMDISEHTSTSNMLLKCLLKHPRYGKAGVQRGLHSHLSAFFHKPVVDVIPSGVERTTALQMALEASNCPFRSKLSRISGGNNVKVADEVHFSYKPLIATVHMKAFLLLSSNALTAIQLLEISSEVSGMVEAEVNSIMERVNDNRFPRVPTSSSSYRDIRKASRRKGLHLTNSYCSEVRNPTDMSSAEIGASVGLLLDTLQFSVRTYCAVVWSELVADAHLTSCKAANLKIKSNTERELGVLESLSFILSGEVVASDDNSFKYNTGNMDCGTSACSTEKGADNTLQSTKYFPKLQHIKDVDTDYLRNQLLNTIQISISGLNRLLVSHLATRRFLLAQQRQLEEQNQYTPFPYCKINAYNSSVSNTDIECSGKPLFSNIDIISLAACSALMHVVDGYKYTTNVDIRQEALSNTSYRGISVFNEAKRRPSVLPGTSSNINKEIEEASDNSDNIHDDRGILTRFCRGYHGNIKRYYSIGHNIARLLVIPSIMHPEATRGGDGYNGCSIGIIDRRGATARGKDSNMVDVSGVNKKQKIPLFVMQCLRKVVG